MDRTYGIRIYRIWFGEFQGFSEAEDFESPSPLGLRKGFSPTGVR